jgi:transmembrane secretion effector
MSLFNTMIQNLAPDWVRARVLVAYLFVYQGSVAIGSAVWGLAAEHANARMALFVSGIGIGGSSEFQRIGAPGLGCFRAHRSEKSILSQSTSCAAISSARFTTSSIRKPSLTPPQLETIRLVIQLAAASFPGIKNASALTLSFCHPRRFRMPFVFSIIVGWPQR